MNNIIGACKTGVGARGMEVGHGSWRCGMGTVVGHGSWEWGMGNGGEAWEMGVGHGGWGWGMGEWSGKWEAGLGHQEWGRSTEAGNAAWLFHEWWLQRRGACFMLGSPF